MNWPIAVFSKILIHSIKFTILVFGLVCAARTVNTWPVKMMYFFISEEKAVIIQTLGQLLSIDMIQQFYNRFMLFIYGLGFPYGSLIHVCSMGESRKTKRKVIQSVYLCSYIYIKVAKIIG